MGRIIQDGIPYHIDRFEPYLGKVVGVSEWLKITQQRIDEFGRATSDMNRIHVDPEFARASSPFGGIVAHGFLTLSLLTHFSQSSQMMPDGVDYGINVGFERVRFLAPVPVDAHIRMKTTALACEPRGPGRWSFKSRCSIEVKETQKVALSAVWIVLLINTAKAGAGAAAEFAETRAKG
jgi:acyl dehydratase